MMTQVWVDIATLVSSKAIGITLSAVGLAGLAHSLEHFSPIFRSAFGAADGDTLLTCLLLPLLRGCVQPCDALVALRTLAAEHTPASARTQGSEGFRQRAPG